MGNLLGDDIVKAVRDLDPATDQAARGIDHYVQRAGDKLDESVLGKKPTAPKTPPAVDTSSDLQTPVAMPTQNSAEARAAKRRSIAIQAARRGRLSTILTNDDALGG